MCKDTPPDYSPNMRQIYDLEPPRRTQPNIESTGSAGESRHTRRGQGLHELSRDVNAAQVGSSNPGL